MRKKMKGLLSIDKNFVPTSVDDGNELYPNGFFLFNITKLSEYIHNNADEITPELIEVKAIRNGLAVVAGGRRSNENGGIKVVGAGGWMQMYVAEKYRSRD